MKRDVSIWLKALVTYMCKSLDVPNARMLRKVWMKHSTKAEINNQRSSRSFCYVYGDGEPVVHYAEALTRLNTENVVGILIHELAHLIVQSGPVDDEVDADQWILEAFPEAKYRYTDAVYVSPWTERMRTARNVQCVSREFLRKLV